ncbi:MAG TPA: MerR family transcriptional regulator [Mycobacteriales bacterium]|nr:MerR family transcriptional regulator [Mycobacteriales bacterium]
MDDTGVGERTIDDLAREAGTKVSTVRLYQQRGLLPPPRLVGRTGWYGDGHLDRLRIIGRLQERGYSLAAIRELVDSWESGRSLDDLLGATRADSGPGPATIRLTRAELLARVPGLADPALFDRAVALGAISPGPGTDVEAHSGFLAAGDALRDLGVPDARQLDEFARVRAFARDTAARFLALFDEYVWSDFAERGYPTAELDRLTATVERLRTLGREVVGGTLDQAVQDAAREALPRYAERVARAGEHPADSSPGG